MACGSATSTSSDVGSASARSSRRSAATCGSSRRRRAKRTFALPAFLVDELAAHLAAYRPGAAPGDLVFLGPKGGLLRRSFQARVFKPSVEATGLPSTLTFHGLRHVATTLMIANNEHPKVIQHRLGHADPAMSLGVYGHVPDDLDQVAAERLHRSFESPRVDRRKDL